MDVAITYQPLTGDLISGIITFGGSNPNEASDFTLSGSISMDDLESIVSVCPESSVMGFTRSLTSATPDAILRTLEYMGAEVEWPDEWLEAGDFSLWDVEEIN